MVFLKDKALAVLKSFKKQQDLKFIPHAFQPGCNLELIKTRLSYFCMGLESQLYLILFVYWAQERA